MVYSQPSLDATAAVFLDPNKLSEDGTVALSSLAFSEDGGHAAYALSSGGSDWQTVHVARVDASTGAPAVLPDQLAHVKFSSLAWTHDGRGFFYNRYPAPGGGKEAGTETDRAANQQLAYHVLGQPQSQDCTILTLPEHPDWMIGAQARGVEGVFLVVIVGGGGCSRRTV